MLNVQKKSLEHSLKLLNSLDFDLVINRIESIMESDEIGSESIDRVISVFRSKMTDQRMLISESMEWTKSVISDLK
jgi:hypothetical protein